MDLAHGLLAREQLEILTAALADDPKRPMITCLHHGPAGPCPFSGCRLHNDADLLTSLVSRSNACAVLSGHLHAPVEHEVEHVKLLTAPSTCSQLSQAQLGESVDQEDFLASHKLDPSRYGFRMLTLAPDGQLESQLHWVSAA